MTAPLVLLTLLTATYVALRWRPHFTIGLVLGLPVFFRLSGEDGIDFGGSILSPQPGVTLPFAAFAVPLFFAVHAGRPLALGRPRGPDALLCAFVAWSLLAAVAAAALGSGLPSPLVFAQTLFPLVMYVLGRLDTEPRALERMGAGLVTGTALAAGWLMASGVFTQDPARTQGRLSDELTGGLIMYQVYDYFPVLLTLGFALAAGLLLRDRKLRYAAALIVVAGCIVLLYSRTGAASLLAVCGIVAWQARSQISVRVRVIAAAAAVLIVAASFALGLAAATRLVASLGGGDDENVAGSNQTRADAMRAAARLVAQNPVTGRGFAPTFEDPSTGVATTARAHNQYLDHAVRGGVPLALAFIALLILVLREARRLLRADDRPPLVAEAAIAVLVAAVVSNATQVTFVQPLTALPLWLLLGLLAGRAQRPVPA